MADKYSDRDDRPGTKQDETVNRGSDDQVRGIASDETDEFDENTEDLDDEEDETEDEEGGGI